LISGIVRGKGGCGCGSSGCESGEVIVSDSNQELDDPEEDIEERINRAIAKTLADVLSDVVNRCISTSLEGCIEFD
jgi:hypothetical protein